MPSHTIRKALLGSTAGATLALLLSTGALAQTAAPAAAPAPAAAAPSASVEEIVVTGTTANRFGTDTVQSGSFRNAKVLDVPLTVSVIPDAVIKSQQALDLMDAVKNTAGVSTTGSNPIAYSNLTIRGIAVDTRANYRLDGALNMLSATAFPLEDKDRVEVLKGASALYYGFSAPAGIVNLTMKRATPFFTTSGDVFGDSNGGYGGHVDIGDTIGKFGYRINGVAAQLNTGVTYSKGNRAALGTTFDIKATDRLTFSGDMEIFRKNIVEPALFSLTIPTGARSVNIPNIDKLNPSTNIGGADWDVNRTHEYNLLGKANYKISSDWNLSGYIGKSDLFRARNNPQFTPTNLTTAIDPNSPTYGAGQVRFSAQQATFDNVNYAVEMTGVLRLAGIKDEVLVGASRTQRALASSANVRTAFNQNFANPTLIRDPHLIFTDLPPISHTDDKGLYLFNRVFITDYIQLLGGVRKSDYSNDGSINAITKTPYTANPTSYSGGFVIKPRKWISLYGTYIEGLEETAAAPSNTDNATQVFAPTNTIQYEGGIKLEPRTNLLFQLAYFRIDRGGAYAANLPGSTVLHYYTNGRQLYEGVEFSATGYVTPDLAIYLSATELGAHYRGQPGIDGHRVDGTPDSSWSVAGEYTLSWLNPNLKLTAGVYDTGSQAINADNVAFTPAYTTLDLGGSYTLNYNKHSVIFRVTGQNITNKRYWSSVGGNALAESVPGEVKFSIAMNY